MRRDDPQSRRDDRHSRRRPARPHARHRGAESRPALPHFRARSRGARLRRRRGREPSRPSTTRRRSPGSPKRSTSSPTNSRTCRSRRSSSWRRAGPSAPAPARWRLTQDRLTEKTFLRDLGLKTAPFVGVEDAGALARAVAELGRPAILKTRRFGYDGKGQSLIREGSNVAAVHRALGGGADDPRRVRRLRARSIGRRRAQPRGRGRRLRPERERARAPYPGENARAGPRRAARPRPRRSGSPSQSSKRSTMSGCSPSNCS